MSGHSKWANIKRQKAVQDAKKGKTYAKLSRDIIVAAKIAGGDPKANFRLRTAIERARTAGVPNDNIKRAIEKGSGAGGGDQLETVIYEGYGPAGVAVFIETMTDNRHRTAGDIRSYFNKYLGNLGADGCVAWIFEEKGLIRIQKSIAEKAGFSEEGLFEKAVEAGALDFQYNAEENSYDIYTGPLELEPVCRALTENTDISIDSAEVTRIPQNSINVTDADHAKALMKLLDAIESHDDVQAVYANFEMEDVLFHQFS